MEFCPKCGGMILPQEVWDEDYKQIVLKCSTCGYESSEADKAEYSVEKKVNSEDIVILGEDERMRGSTVNEFCPRCGHNRAIRDIRQVKGIAEGPTFFFRCEKCGFTWRDQ